MAPITAPASTGASTSSAKRRIFVSMSSRSMDLGRVRTMEPWGFKLTSSACRDMVTFTVATGSLSLVMVTRWKLSKPYSSSRLLSRNWPCFSFSSPGTCMGPEPSTTEMRSSSPSSAAATRHRPASSVVPVFPPMHLS